MKIYIYIYIMLSIVKQKTLIILHMNKQESLRDHSLNL